MVDFENLEKKDVLENGILKGSPARKAKLSHWHLSGYMITNWHKTWSINRCFPWLALKHQNSSDVLNHGHTMHIANMLHRTSK